MLIQYYDVQRETKHCHTKRVGRKNKVVFSKTRVPVSRVRFIVGDDRPRRSGEIELVARKRDDEKLGRISFDLSERSAKAIKSLGHAILSTIPSRLMYALRAVTVARPYKCLFVREPFCGIRLIWFSTDVVAHTCIILSSSTCTIARTKRSITCRFTGNESF